MKPGYLCSSMGHDYYRDEDGKYWDIFYAPSSSGMSYGLVHREVVAEEEIQGILKLAATIGRE